MKVGIVGNYGNNNKGDEAILEGIIQQLEEGLQPESVMKNLMNLV